MPISRIHGGAQVESRPNRRVRPLGAAGSRELARGSRSWARGRLANARASEFGCCVVAVSLGKRVLILLIWML